VQQLPQEHSFTTEPRRVGAIAGGSVLQLNSQELAFGTQPQRVGALAGGDTHECYDKEGWSQPFTVPGCLRKVQYTRDGLARYLN
jgi:hypothetical protein